MYNSVFPKKFKSVGQTPSPDEMVQGELIINTADAKLYTKDINGAIQLIASPAIQDITILNDADITVLAGLDTQVGDIPVGAGTAGWYSLVPGPDGSVLQVDSTQYGVGLKWSVLSDFTALDPDSPAFIFRGANGQTANIAQVNNYANQVLAAIDPNGWMFLGRTQAYGNTVFSADGNESANIGIRSHIVHDVIYDENIDKYVYLGTVNPTVATGYTESGSSNGIRIDVLRGGTSTGTLHELVGIQANYGSQYSNTVQPNSPGTTAYVYGLQLQPSNQMGLIQVLYDLYIGEPINSSTPGNIETHYSIFQQDPSAQNYFGGKVTIGTTSNSVGAALLVNSSTSNLQTYINCSYNITSSQSEVSTGLQIDLSKNFSGGVNDTGSLSGLLSNILIVGNGSLLGSLIGHKSRYGANLGTAGLLTTVYGLQLLPQCANCTVSTLYDLYIGTPSGSNSVITHHYAIYQSDSTAINFLAGSLAIGGTTSMPLATINSNGSIGLASLADNVATSNSLYYSTTSNKLCYKDPSGNLYILTTQP